MIRFLAVALCLGGLIPRPAAADEIDTLQARIVADFALYTDTSAVDFLASQNADGSWSDIDYDDVTATTWLPVEHLQRLRQMGMAQYNSPSPAMLAGVEAGLRYWYTEKPTSDSWYKRDIGQQLWMAPTLLLLEDQLAADIIDTGCVYLNDSAYTMTGANLVNVKTQKVWRGCLQENLTDITSALNDIKAEIRYSISEGIQYDGSFLQHGPHLYNGSYGYVFLNDIVSLVYYSNGLSFAFNSAKMDILATLLLTGNGQMFRRGRIDAATTGRGISRPDFTNSEKYRIFYERMAIADAGRSAVYRSLVNHLDGIEDSVLSGNRHYWRADYQVHRRKDYFMSVNMCSKRTIRTECIDDENVRCRYLPFGHMSTMVTGEEYTEIYPVWDWARIPGVTLPYKSIPVQPRTYQQYGPTYFVGGVSDGTNGAAVLDLDFEGVSGKKSWFFFEEGCMALGAAVTCTTGETVNTTLNQCLLDGDVTVAYDGGAGSAPDTGGVTLASPRWVHHGGVGYVFPETGNVMLNTGKRTGSWYHINLRQSADPITKDVFTLWLDHGADPSGASYAYAVLPGMDASGVQAFAADNPYVVVANTDSVQAVRHAGDRITSIIFHKPGELDLGNGTVVQVDNACAVMVNESTDTASVTVSNPRNTAMTVTLNLLRAGVDSTGFVITLPYGSSKQYAGKSITVSSGGSVVPPDTTVPVTDTAYVNGIGIISSDDSNTPVTNIMDGDFDTRWSADGDGQWIQFDMGHAVSFTGIGLAFYSGDSRTATFTVSVSGNGTDWAGVLGATVSSGTSTDLEDFPFDTTAARYLRITGYGNSVNGWCSYTEVRLDTALVASGTPVGISSFTVTGNGGDVDLAWTTESENGNIGFYVQRSSVPDGPFSQLNTTIIAGAGTTVTPQQYSFTDYDPGNGTWYYRLEQVDIGGELHYSRMESLEINITGISDGHRESGQSASDMVFLISANPADGTVLFRAVGRVKIYNTTGQLIHEFRPAADGPALNVIRWDGTDLAGKIVESGVYYVHYNDAIRTITVVR